MKFGLKTQRRFKFFSTYDKIQNFKMETQDLLTQINLESGSVLLDVSNTEDLYRFYTKTTVIRHLGLMNNLFSSLENIYVLKIISFIQIFRLIYLHSKNIAIYSHFTSFEKSYVGRISGLK